MIIVVIELSYFIVTDQENKQTNKQTKQNKKQKSNSIFAPRVWRLSKIL